jgi:hypothetical protein
VRRRDSLVVELESNPTVHWPHLFEDVFEAIGGSATAKEIERQTALYESAIAADGDNPEPAVHALAEEDRHVMSPRGRTRGACRSSRISRAEV